MTARLFLGDCVEVMKGMDAESIDAIVCDPPYGLEFMGKDWDKFSDRELVTRTGHDRAGSGAGFNETPNGSKLPSFGGSLCSYECVVCGVRDAFRKGCRCETPDWRAINPNGTAPMVAFQRFSQQWAEAAYRVLKPGGHVLAFGGTRTYHRLTVGLEDAGFEIRDSLHWIYGSGFPKSLDVSKAIDKKAGVERTDRVVGAPGGNKVFSPSVSVVNPGTPVTAAAAAGLGTGLKPAHEPIVLARKPLSGTVSETVIEHGTGALNLKGCEIGTSGGTKQVTPKEKASGREATSYGASIGSAGGGNVPDGGRWPANVLLGHLPECAGSGASNTDVLCAPGCPVAELNQMSGESSSSSLSPLPKTPGDARGRAHGNRDKATVRGHDDAGGAARFFYVAKPKTRERIGGTTRNLHPTVKPIDLMRYLVRLVTPAGGVVLDPFLGSGTTGCAAMVEGLDFVGIERERPSFETSAERVSDYAFANGRERPELVVPSI